MNPPAIPAPVASRGGRWTMPLGRGLFLQVAAVLLGLYVGLTVTAYFHRRETVARLSARLLDQAGALTEARLGQFFNPVFEAGALLAEEVLAGDLSPDRPETLRDTALPLLRVTRTVAAAGVGQADGSVAFLSREAGHWLLRHSPPGGAATPSEFWRQRMGGTNWERWTENDGYDPRERPWFRAAQALPPVQTTAEAAEFGRRAAWTEPYPFTRTKALGMTASLRVQPPGRPVTVLGVDVALAELAGFLNDIRPTTNFGVALLLSDEGRLLGLPPYLGLGVEEMPFREMLGAVGVSDDLAARVLEEWQAARRAGLTVMKRLGEEQVFWLGFRPYQLGNQRFWLFVALPEAELARPLVSRDRQIVWVLAGALLVGMLLALAVARHTARPLAALAEDAERTGRLELEASARRPTGWREIAALEEAHRRMRAALGSFASYVPAELVRQLLRRGEAARIGGHTETLTVLFTDLEEFTSLAEEVPAAQVAHELSDYFSVMVGALQEHAATIDKFIGDSVLAFWGAPEPQPDGARRAVVAVLECEARLVALNARRQAAGRPALRTRYGLARGPVVVGNVGTASRMNYTVLGNIVNVASRLEGLNKRFGSLILATREVREAAGAGFAWQRLGPILVKGKTQSVEVEELLGRTEETAPDRLRRAGGYEAVLAAIEAREPQASGQLEALAAARPGDARVAFLAELLRQGHPAATGATTTAIVAPAPAAGTQPPASP